MDAAQTLTVEEMMDQLIQNYDEMYHDDPDGYNPEHYEQYLEEMSEDELVELYKETYGDD